MRPSRFFRFSRFLRRHRRAVAGLCAGLAVLAGVSALTQSGDDATAVVTSKDLTAGHRLVEEDLRVVQVPGRVLPDRVTSDLTTAVGRMLAVDLPRNAVLSPTLVVDPATVASPGRIVVPVLLSPLATGLVRPGDRIDLFGRDQTQDRGALLAAQARVVALPQLGRTDPSLLSAGVPAAGVLALVEVLPAAAELLATAGDAPLTFAFR